MKRLISSGTWESKVKFILCFMTLYLAVSLAYLNEYLCFPEIKRRIEVLMFSVDLSKIEDELYIRIMNINDGWFGAVAI